MSTIFHVVPKDGYYIVNKDNLVFIPDEDVESISTNCKWWQFWIPTSRLISKTYPKAKIYYYKAGTVTAYGCEDLRVG